jgi:polyisoprenoid-binding protein YceI
MKRLRNAGLVLSFVLAVAGCGRAPEGNSVPAAAESTNPGAAKSPVTDNPGGTQTPAPSVPQISKWELDPENSSVEFVCKHVFTNVRGMFPKPSGTVVLDDTTPAHSKVDVTMDVNAITTGVEERDTHLKGPDFFDAAKYPAITFVSTGISKSSATSYSVTGNLTMHGVTKPVTLAVTAPPPFNHAGGVRRGIEATTTVNRKDFGLLWEFPGEGAGVVVGDNVKITIDAELVLQPESSPGR